MNSSDPKDPRKLSQKQALEEKDSDSTRETPSLWVMDKKPRQAKRNLHWRLSSFISLHIRSALISGCRPVLAKRSRKGDPSQLNDLGYR